MDESLKNELEIGNKATVELAKHLYRMNACKAEERVKAEGTDDIFIVTVERKKNGTT